MTVPNYHRAVYAAYRMRTEYDTGQLLFDPFLPLSVEEKLRVCKFSTFCANFGPWAEEYIHGASEDAFTVRINGGYVVCYNDAPRISPTRRRFSLAHELGHYALRHHRNAEWEEKEADCFARNLLAPRLFAIAYDVDFEDYQIVFGISAAAAQMCERMQFIDEQIANDVLNKKR